jgi:hypothetical protein
VASECTLPFLPPCPLAPTALVGTALVQHSPSSASPDSYYQKSEKKCADKFCSDSSSDCGSSSGSVRASRGSWGSWSSSSSDCDRRPVVDIQHFLPPGESEAPCLPAASAGLPCRGQSACLASGCLLSSPPFSS